MGIQDDIFDVEDFLENHITDHTYVKDAFDRIIFYIGKLEKSVEECHRYINELETTIKVIREFEVDGG